MRPVHGFQPPSAPTACKSFPSVRTAPYPAHNWRNARPARERPQDQRQPERLSGAHSFQPLHARSIQGTRAIQQASASYSHALRPCLISAVSLHIIRRKMTLSMDAFYIEKPPLSSIRSASPGHIQSSRNRPVQPHHKSRSSLRPPAPSPRTAPCAMCRAHSESPAECRASHCRPPCTPTRRSGRDGAA